jgi:hypothetical protein
MTDGIAGLVFMDDVINLIKDNWTSNGGKLPNFTKLWETKEFGLGTNNDEKVIISLDGENPEIFSLKYHDGEGNPIYDWLHTVSVSADVWTGKSENRVLELVSEIVRILKNNVVVQIGNNQYIQMLPVNVSSALEQYRNIYRYVIDIEVMRLNP